MGLQLKIVLVIVVCTVEVVRDMDAVEVIVGENELVLEEEDEDKLIVALLDAVTERELELVEDVTAVPIVSAIQLWRGSEIYIK